MQITTDYHDLFARQDTAESIFPATVRLNGLTIRTAGNDEYALCLVDLEQLAAQLQEKKENFFASLLSEQECTHLAGYRYPKRRHEWLGGRLAVKTALQLLERHRCCPTGLRKLTILPDKYGRPVPDSGASCSISISHSHGRAVGMADSRRRGCGVDIQKIDPRLLHLTERFASESELRILKSLPTNPETRLTILWAAKEALKKSILYDQPSIFSGITVQQMKPSGQGLSLLCSAPDRRMQSVTVHICSPYIIAYTRDHARTP